MSKHNTIHAVINLIENSTNLDAGQDLGPGKNGTKLFVCLFFPDGVKYKG
jgi:hypothetical protein